MFKLQYSFSCLWWRRAKTAFKYIAHSILSKLESVINIEAKILKQDKYKRLNQFEKSMEVHFNRLKIFLLYFYDANDVNL